MQRLFSTFPEGWPGIGLVFLRTVAAILAIQQGIAGLLTTSLGAQAIVQLTAALFRETNPAPVKFALSLFGLMAPRLRLPLVEIGEKTKRELTGIVARLCNDWSASMIVRIDKPLGAWRRAS